MISIIYLTRPLKNIFVALVALFVGANKSEANLSLVINVNEGTFQWSGSVETIASGTVLPSFDFGDYGSEDYVLDRPDILLENLPILLGPVALVSFDLNDSVTAIRGVSFVSPFAIGDFEYRLSAPSPNNMPSQIFGSPEIETILGQLDIEQYTFAPVANFWNGDVIVTVVPEPKNGALLMAVLSVAFLTSRRRCR